MFTGSYELIGKRVKEESCRIAWEEMEHDLALPRPTFDYIPEKYTKIKTSVYHPSCPKPRLDGCEESDSMCDCPATESDRCGPNSKCTNRAILQECPEACEAIGSGCNNRGVSRKEVNPAMVIREAPGKGLGAFAVRNIPKGSFIAEYAGEIISNKEMNRRIAEITAHRNVEEKHYMMALDSQRIIDCKEKGNDARFLNHSCSPNCKVETVYVVVSKTKRPSGVYVKDYIIGSELCFNYQMRQYNMGCPLPDCKCGAPNCTGTLGAIAGPAAEKVDTDAHAADIAKQKRKKRRNDSLSTQELLEKKKKPAVGKRKTVSDNSQRSSSNSRSLGQDKKSVLEGRPTVIFKKALNSSKSQVQIRDSPSQLRRMRSRRIKKVERIKGVLRGSENSDVASENVIAEKLLSRAFLKGTLQALERFPNNASSQRLDDETIPRKANGLRRTRRLAELFPSNGSL
ncbi:SET domain protein [Dictyocaulus viviparus]|uniref:SET domain protein n=1 Tax=Dictyocaulus viviparus TaxID=29172 RepID=A0A0D8Y7X1_DICVI|nr:SET domain protein [Dictyocaulus viviparus]